MEWNCVNYQPVVYYTLPLLVGAFFLGLVGMMTLVYDYWYYTYDYQCERIAFQERLEELDLELGLQHFQQKDSA